MDAWRMPAASGIVSPSVLSSRTGRRTPIRALHSQSNCSQDASMIGVAARTSRWVQTCCRTTRANSSAMPAT
jgi:hypothetical protein